MKGAQRLLRRLGTAVAKTMAGCGIAVQLSACAPMNPPIDNASLGRTPTAHIELVAFETSPFPYQGNVPADGTPFLNVAEGERRGHAAPRGGTYWEDQTYSDRRALLYIPKGFDPRRPAVMVVFFHGNNATLERDVRDRQGIPRQIAKSGLNAVLVAPQFAVDARDSSAGRFWEPGAFRQFLREASGRLAQLDGREQLQATFDRLPVILVAYSGGYSPAASSLDVGDANDRVQGVILLDALYGDEDKFSAWIARRGSGLFVSAYSKSARDQNLALQGMLSARGIAFATGLSGRLEPGSVTFIDAGDAADHNDFATRAWDDDPLEKLLARLGDYPRS